MKKLFFVAIVILVVYNQGKAQIKVNSSGNVAIGNVNPNSYKLYLKGTAQLQPGTTGSIIIDNTGYCSSPALYSCANVGKSGYCCYEVWSYFFRTCSDIRQKENIRNIPDGLNLVLKLKGVKYDYKNSPDLFNTLAESGQNDALIDSLRRNHVGYIAQDVIDIIPEAVGYDKSTDRYSIDYMKFIPFITEAIKEQQLIILSLQSEIQELKTDSNRYGNLKSTASTTGITEIKENTGNILYQNTPNPFYQTTIIEYFLNANIQKAMICIYDMNGTQLKCIPLHLSGYGNITVNGNELKAGMYLYTLMVDGKEIGTKRMILTD